MLYGHPILVTIPHGQQVCVETSSVRSLAPNDVTPGTTTLFLNDSEVTTDERYETFMAQFAAAWPLYSL